MRIIHSYILIILFFSYQLNSQCSIKSVELLNQFDIDTFSQNHPLCDSLIDLFVGDDVLSLEPLIQLKHVDNLYIWNTNKLKNLAGLDSLRSIGDELYIRSNDSLSSIASLHMVEELTNLKVENNINLRNFNGLQNIEELVNCIILSNPLIENLEGLGGLSFCRSLSLAGNISLIGLNPDIELNTIFLNQNRIIKSINTMSNFADLSQVRSLVILQTESFSLDGIDKMDSLLSLNLNFVINPDIESFADLQRPINNISIELCQNLQNLDALRNKEIKTIYLRDLQNLTDVSGLNNLDANSYVSLINLPMLEDISIFNESDSAGFRIEGNEKLSKCAMTAICNGLYADDNSVDISDNADGCNGNEEVKNQCLTSTQNIENQLLLYPNPVVDDLAIKSEVAYDSYEIYSIQGKIVSVGYIFNNKIPFSNLSSNLYILKLKKEESFDFMKVIKL